MTDSDNTSTETGTAIPQPRPANNANNSNRNPYTLWFVVLSFVAPAVLAYSVYFFGDIQSFTNKGEILDPIVNISEFGLREKDGTPIPKDKLTYKWRMISFLKADCDEACQSRIYDTRQVYTSLGKDRHRVMRMFVHLEPASEALDRLVEEQHPNVIHVYGDETEIVKALTDDASITDNEVYIMDPMGSVMMRFSHDQPNKDLLKDIKRLLKASQIG